MTPKTVRKALQGLQDKGVIDGSFIKCPARLLDYGFSELSKTKELKGLQLLLYNYIKDRQYFFGGSIDTWEYKLAEVLHTKTNIIKNAIHELKEKGFVQRTLTGKLQVL